MVLDNILILSGSYTDIKEVKEEFDKLCKKSKSSKLYNKKIKNLIVNEPQEHNQLYHLKINFKYKGTNIKEFLETLTPYSIEIIHMCEHAKSEVWIVNNKEYITKYQLIPSFAIKNILLDYMEYRESAIILDSYETIKYDLNYRQLVVDNLKPSYDELLKLLFEKTIKGRYFYEIIDNFIMNYYDKCINTYEELYSISKESSDTEETSPLGLFIITIGIFAIILLLLKVMGYL